MSWLIPKTYLKWQEPIPARQYLHHDYFTARRILRDPAIFFVMFMGVWALSWLQMLAGIWPYKTHGPLNLVESLLISIGVSILLIIVLLLRHWFASSEVLLTEKGVQHRLAGDAPIWSYSQIKFFRVEKLEIPQGTFNVLVLTNHNNKVWKLVIAQSIDITALRRVLTEKGIMPVST
jgi:hypothetical protein